jgi:hypothetical protein
MPPPHAVASLFFDVQRAACRLASFTSAFNLR